MVKVRCARTTMLDVERAGELREPCGALRRLVALSSLQDEVNKYSLYDLGHKVPCAPTTYALDMAAAVLCLIGEKLTKPNVSVTWVRRQLSGAGYKE